MQSSRIKRHCRATLLASILISFSAVAQTSDPSEVAAISGYSPVSYFEHNRAEPGNPEFRVKYREKVYYFTSADQVAKFESDPEKYRPLFNENCPYSLALGRSVAIDPTNFKIVAGRLLLFHKSSELNGLYEWNRRASEEPLLLRRAKAQFERLRSE